MNLVNIEFTVQKEESGNLIFENNKKILKMYKFNILKNNKNILFQGNKIEIFCQYLLNCKMRNNNVHFFLRYFCIL